MASLLETISRMRDELVYDAGYKLGKYASEAAFQRHINPRLQSAKAIAKKIDKHAYEAGQAARNLEMPEFGELPSVFGELFEDLPGSEAFIDEVLEVMPGIYSEIPSIEVPLPRIEGIPEMSIPAFDAEAAVGATARLIEKVGNLIPESAIKGFTEGFIDRGKRNTHLSRLTIEKEIGPAVSRGGWNFFRGLLNRQPISVPGDSLTNSSRGLIGTLDSGEREVEAAMRIYDQEHNGQIIDFEGEGRSMSASGINLTEGRTGSFELGDDNVLRQVPRELRFSSSSSMQASDATDTTSLLSSGYVLSESSSRSSSRSVRNKPGSVSSIPDDETPLLGSSASNSSSSLSSGQALSVAQPGSNPVGIEGVGRTVASEGGFLNSLMNMLSSWRASRTQEPGFTRLSAQFLSTSALGDEFAAQQTIPRSMSAPPSTEAGRGAGIRGKGSEGSMDKKFMGLMGAQMGLEFLNSSINQITAEAERDVQLMASSQQQAELNEENNAQADQNRHSEGLQWLQMRRGSRRF